LILVNELKGKIRAKGYTQEKLAKELGISPKTLSNKLTKGIFGSDEIEKMIKILGIDNPIEIFFIQ
jgi:transcriptional regulator with XRE-family HTH domain